jgi:hypothetical protein
VGVYMEPRGRWTEKFWKHWFRLSEIQEISFECMFEFTGLDKMYL